MYYDNKSTFYIKQYGPKVLVGMLSVILVVGGIYIYMASTKTSAPENNVADENKEVVEIAKNENTEVASVETVTKEVAEEKKEEVIETNSLQNEDKIEISTTISKTLANLNPLEKSNVAVVKSVTDNGTVIVNIDNRNLEINLIGVDFSRSPSNVNETLKKDLEGKEVRLAFDKVKVKDMKLYAYIYVGETLYNASIIEKGQAIVKIESTNTSLLDTLVSAQAKAKTAKAGIWAN